MTRKSDGAQRTQREEDMPPEMLVAFWASRYLTTDWTGSYPAGHV